jgi:hypothetical protein
MKVVFDMVAKQITIEGAGADLLAVLEKVRDIAPQVSEIKILTGPSGPQNNGGSVGGVAGTDVGGNGAGTVGGKSVPTIKEFGKSVAPSTAAERIATIATYVKRYEKKETFSPKDMNDWFTHCSFTKPSQMGVALQDTKSNTGYIENTGYGKWKLTVAGENFVTRKLEHGGAT